MAWLKGHPSRWKPFVANRISEIVTAIPTARWSHVGTKENPADLAARGISIARLHESNLWWKGPTWLTQAETDWPSATTIEFATILEARKSAITANHISAIEPSFLQLFNRYSSFGRILSIFCIMLRRLRQRRSQEPRPFPGPSAFERQLALRSLLRLVQQETFPVELKAVAASQQLPQSSRIRRLSPFINLHGMLCIGDRLQHAPLSKSERHPIILPAKHFVTELLVRHAHHITLHGGPALVQSYLSRQFWILHGRNLIRKVVRQCVPCTRFRGATANQLMGAVPAPRVIPARSFSHTGLVNAGPSGFVPLPVVAKRLIKDMVPYSFVSRSRPCI